MGILSEEKDVRPAVVWADDFVGCKMGRVVCLHFFFIHFLKYIFVFRRRDFHALTVPTECVIRCV